MRKAVLLICILHWNLPGQAQPQTDTLLRLKLANPDRVFLLRGNHEEISIAATYGFLSEGTDFLVSPSR